MTTRPELIDRLYGLPLPKELTSKDLALAMRDAEILIAAMREKGPELLAAAQAVLDGDAEAARARLAINHLLEEDYQAQGGGFIALVILVILLYATSAY